MMALRCVPGKENSSRTGTGNQAVRSTRAATGDGHEFRMSCDGLATATATMRDRKLSILRYFTLAGTDHASHKEQASMIRRYIIWRNNHAYDERLRRIIDRANVA
jgi:hypothetical protein